MTAGGSSPVSSSKPWPIKQEGPLRSSDGNQPRRLHVDTRAACRGLSAANDEHRVIRWILVVSCAIIFSCPGAGRWPDQGGPFTSAAFTGAPLNHGVSISGRQRLLARQRVGRAPMAQRQIRGGLPESLRQRQRTRLPRRLPGLAFYNRRPHSSLTGARQTRLTSSGRHSRVASRKSCAEDRI